MLTESTWQDELRTGLSLCHKGNYDLALIRFRRAHQLAPTRPEPACALGREHMRRGNATLACDFLRSSWESDQTLLSAGTSLARCLGLDLEQYQEAHQVLDQVEKLHSDCMARLIRGELLLAEGRHEDAGIVANALIANKSVPPKEQARIVHSAHLLMARVENQRGMCAIEQHEYEKAIFAFKRACDLDPQWAAPQCNLGAAFDTLGKWQRAQQSYRAASELDPHYPQAWHNLALLYQKRGDPRALHCFQQAYCNAPSQVELTVDFAIALHRQGSSDACNVVLDGFIREGTANEDRSELATALRIRNAEPLIEEYLRDDEPSGMP